MAFHKISHIKIDNNDNPYMLPLPAVVCLNGKTEGLILPGWIGINCDNRFKSDLVTSSVIKSQYLSQVVAKAVNNIGFHSREHGENSIYENTHTAMTGSYPPTPNHQLINANNSTTDQQLSYGYSKVTCYMILHRPSRSTIISLSY